MKLSNEIGAIILRITLGALFFIHGLVKFQGGIENIAGWFSSIGLPGFMAYVIALMELIGGIALIIGLGTRVVSGLFALILIGATVKVKLVAGLLGNGQMAGYELDLVYFVIAVYLVLNGSKLYAMDALLFKSGTENMSKVA